MIMKHLLLLLALVLCSAFAAAQSHTVSGTVRDAAGNPLPGVAVMVPGTTIGTVTDIDGHYTLSVTGNPTLSATFIGMQPGQINLANGQTDVTLQDEETEMDEVIVVAFGQTTKQAFTGSAAVVSADELEKRTTSNVANQLAGAVPGLQMRGVDGAPGSSGGSIAIRGISSLYASTTPLVIVDGAPFPGNLSDIAASEIESVTVLKDAASAALYGARGASGVILITTKKGANKEGQINVEAKWGVNSRSVQDYDVITDPGEYYEAYYAQLYNYYYYGQGYSEKQANATANETMLSQLGYQSMTVPNGEYLIGSDGKINPNATLGYVYTGIDGEQYYVYPDDWTDAAYSRSPRQEYTVTANGGNDRGSYFASVNFLKDDGIIEYTGYQRLTARIKADYQIKKWLKLNANIGYTNSKTISNANMDYSDEPDLNEANLMYFVSSIAPIYPIYVRNTDGTVKTDSNGNPTYDFNRNNFAKNADEDSPVTMTRGFLDGNPLGNNRYNYVETLGNGLNGNIGGSINFTEKIKLDFRSSLVYKHADGSDYENSLYGSKMSAGGELTRAMTVNIRQNHVQTLNYFDTYNDVHNLSVLVGHEYYRSKGRYLSAVAQGSFSPEVKELNAFATKTDSYSYTSRYNVEGWFGNVQYNYDEKYYLQGSFRRDASSRFADENKWGSFWSVGAAWILSEENFMEATRGVVDELKVKFSIGQQGNDNINDYAYVDVYSLSKATETTMSPTFYRQGNHDITWETVTNANAGVEFSLFKGRLTGAIDYYNKKTTDLLFWLSIPESAGSRGYYGNLGDIRNRGLEVELSGALFRTADLEWRLMGNLSFNKTKILALPASKTADNGGFYEDGCWYAEDGELYNQMMYSYAGVDPNTGKALYYYDEDLSPLGGKVSSNVTSKPGSKKSGTTDVIGNATRYTQGSTLPKIYGGFGTSFTWKGIDLSAQFDYQIGGKIYDVRYADLVSPVADTREAGKNYHKDWIRSWTPNNTASDMPRWQFGDQYATAHSDRFLTDASYLNFSSFTVGYTLPKELTSQILLSKVRIFCAGENLTFWSARKGLDPRFSYMETSQVSNYSPARTISGGIQLQF